MKINEKPPISPATLAPAAGTGRHQPRNDGATSAGSGAAQRAGAPAATVELSPRSRELHDALAAAKAAPDVRQGVVADVKARISNGTYQVDPERIARGILDTTA
jgi:negative regulator of flagellin synthesis FlgM